MIRDLKGVLDCEHAVQLPARREDIFKRAAREEDPRRQSTLDL